VLFRCCDDSVLVTGCCFAFAKICFVCVREGEIEKGKAMMCGGMVAALIGQGEAPDLLAWCG